MNEQLHNAIMLLHALRKNDTSDVNKYRKLTGIQEKDYKKLAAILRFWQIGMANSYEEALALYKEDIKRTKQLDKAGEDFYLDMKITQWSKDSVDAQNAARDREVYGFYDDEAAKMKAKCDVLREKIKKLRGY
ncbi:MAG: hypothetical protein IJ445_05620 [Clostridia bacterium]|nr:hypothetical protein [Clostridia bacterium]